MTCRLGTVTLALLVLCAAVCWHAPAVLAAAAAAPTYCAAYGPESYQCNCHPVCQTCYSCGCEVYVFSSCTFGSCGSSDCWCGSACRCCRAASCAYSCNCVVRT